MVDSVVEVLAVEAEVAEDGVEDVDVEEAGVNLMIRRWVHLKIGSKIVLSYFMNAINKVCVKQWVPVTKLGRLVKDLKIKSLEQIYLFSLPIKVCAYHMKFYEHLRGFC